ncbi:hypothetical protein HTZ77_03305 [Nonomuraea sp. SMC257]|uniref:Uncharacterized protein n=1 Tax=Nonomuraea montanisoli TaxID=2741721 RepID=A0A7Y6I2U6_9ACTN|nr:hypothetical protein [Nonomuraea montanisoli]NUW30456.1 hypothetical protein [Nonomuraea montanisoli]
MGFPDDSESSTQRLAGRFRRKRDDAPGPEAAPTPETSAFATPETSAFATPETSAFARPPYQDKAPAQPAPVVEEPRRQERRATWSPYAEGPKSRGPLWFTLGGVAVLAALVVGLIMMFKAGSESTAIAPTRTSAPLPTTPPGKFGYAADRSTDPEPLTVKELFPTKKFASSGHSYEMTITSKLKKCGDGALGSKLQKALKSGKCTQLIRASFRDKAGKVIGTVGVANLKTGKNATKVASAGSQSNYVKPLPGKDSVTKLVGSGSGGAQVWAHGHYAVMIWFQNKDGSKPDKKSQKAIMGAAVEITKATVFKALDQRSLTGHPA